MLAGLSLRDDCVLAAAVRMQKINLGTQEGERNFTASLMPLESPGKSNGRADAHPP